MALPDRFKCIVTNWDYLYGLCREVAEQIKHSDFRPDIIVALARGGWFPSRVLCDFLGLDDLTSLKIEHYVGTGLAGQGPHIRYPLNGDALAGKRVLIVDDIADTGKSLLHALDYVYSLKPAEVRTATLQHLDTSEYRADFVGEELAEWAWVIFPWNFLEDMIDLTSRLMKRVQLKEWTDDDVAQKLLEYHRLEPAYLEMVQPGRVREVLWEMERRGLVVKVGEGAWRPK